MLLCGGEQWTYFLAASRRWFCPGHLYLHRLDSILCYSNPWRPHSDDAYTLRAFLVHLGGFFGLPAYLLHRSAVDELAEGPTCLLE